MLLFVLDVLIKQGKDILVIRSVGRICAVW